MKKLYIFFMFILISSLLYSADKKVELRSDEVNLTFNNIKIKELEFSLEKDIIIKSKESDAIKIDSDKNKISITSENLTKIKLILPANVTYFYQKKKADLKFSEKFASLNTNDGENIFFQDGELTIKSEKEDQIVKISRKGIFVVDEDGRVEISSDGIVVDKDNQFKEHYGFWGKLAGNFVKVITKSSLSLLGKDSSRFVKYVINDLESNEEKNIFVDLGKLGKSFTKEYEKTVYPLKDSQLTVLNKNGQIKIESWKKDEIKIKAEINSNSEQDLKKIKIKIDDKKNLVIKTEHLEKKINGYVNYDIYIPENLIIKKLRSSNGDIEVLDCEGDMKIETSNSKIVMENCSGNFDLKTSNGAVMISDIFGLTDIFTSNGKVKASNVSQIRNISTSNSPVLLNLTKITNDLNIRTSNGSVNIYLAENCDADVSAFTSNGSIEIDGLDFKDVQKSDHQFEGILGKGKFKIEVHTSNSPIRISKI